MNRTKPKTTKSPNGRAPQRNVKYPTVEEVNADDHKHLRWLSSPVLFTVVHLPRQRLRFEAVSPDQVPTVEELAKLDKPQTLRKAMDRLRATTQAIEPAVPPRSLREVMKLLGGV